MKTRCTRKPRQASAKNRFSALARALAARKCGKHYAGTRMRIDSAGSRATAASHRFSHVRLRSVFHRSVAVSHVWNIFHRTPAETCEIYLAAFAHGTTGENRKLLESQMDFARHTFGRIFCDHTNSEKGAFN